MRIGVILPYYNEEESVVLQTLKSAINAGADRVFLMNDGGKPVQVESNSKIVHIKFESNLKRGLHRQRCNEFVFKDESIDYVTFLDADDMFSSKMIEEVRPNLTSGKSFYRMRFGKMTRRKNENFDFASKAKRIKVLESGDIDIPVTKIMFHGNRNDPKFGRGVLFGLFVKRSELLNATFKNVNYFEDATWTTEMIGGRENDLELILNEHGFYIGFGLETEANKAKYKNEPRWSSTLGKVINCNLKDYREKR